MGVLGKVVDVILLLTFLMVLVIAPLDVQICLPDSVVPNVLKPLYQWYTMITQDYLLLEKPPFFRALMMLEVFFQSPLALLNIYGMLTFKPWFNSTCLILGASLITSTTAMVGDILGSEKPSADLLVLLYSPFFPLGVLAVLRGLLSQCSKAAPTIAKEGLKLTRRVTKIISSLRYHVKTIIWEEFYSCFIYVDKSR